MALSSETPWLPVWSSVERQSGLQSPSHALPELPVVEVPWVRLIFLLLLAGSGGPPGQIAMLTFSWLTILCLSPASGVPFLPSAISTSSKYEGTVRRPPGYRLTSRLLRIANSTVRLLCVCPRVRGCFTRTYDWCYGTS